MFSSAVSQSEVQHGVCNTTCTAHGSVAAITLSWPERLYVIALLVPDGFEAAMQRIVNQTYENMDLRSTQTLGPIPDGLMRNTPDALESIKVTEWQGPPPWFATTGHLRITPRRRPSSSLIRPLCLTQSCSNNVFIWA